MVLRPLGRNKTRVQCMLSINPQLNLPTTIVNLLTRKFGHMFFEVPSNPQSTIHNPQSTIHNPQSTIHRLYSSTSSTQTLNKRACNLEKAYVDRLDFELYATIRRSLEEAYPE